MPGSLALPYKHYTTAQLAKFVARRGLVLHEAAIKKKLSHATRRKVLLTALEDADTNWRSPFFELPGELRNRVYEYLLTGSREGDDRVITCYPQILATCEQANEEGTGILYGENTIEIRLWPNGIFANGLRCGPYRPTLTRSAKFLDFESIVWPEFLRRIRYFHISTSEQAWSPLQPLSALPSGGDFAALSNTIFSLCDFLACDNKLRRCTVSFHIPIDSKFDDDWWQARIDHALDPLRLLHGASGTDKARSNSAVALKRWDENVPRVMEDILCDGVTDLVRSAFRHEFRLASAAVLMIRLILFVPCLLAVWWCGKRLETAAEHDIAAFVKEWYRLHALVYAIRRNRLRRTKFENGFSRVTDEKVMIGEMERASRRKVDYNLFFRRYGKKRV